MITVSQKINLIHTCFGNYKLSGDEKNLSILCPFCEESGKVTKKKKLSIDLKAGIYHCWVCESKGRNIGRVAVKYASNKKAAKALLEVYGDPGKPEDVKLSETIVLPEDFKLITNLSEKEAKNYRTHIKYLKNRGITADHCHKFCIGISENFEYRDRVIFPSFDEEGRLNFFLARSVNPKDSFRYKNCKVSRKNIIFNEFNLDFNKELILTEGVFDLINAPSNSTCILGSWLDENYLLFRKIVKNRTPVVLCLDPDASDKSNKIMKLFNQYCVPARMSQHQNKDFGDMTKLEILSYLESAKPLDFASGVRYLIKNINSGSMF